MSTIEKKLPVWTNDRQHMLIQSLDTVTEATEALTGLLALLRGYSDPGGAEDSEETIHAMIVYLQPLNDKLNATQSTLDSLVDELRADFRGELEGGNDDE
jgi:hypothetical protein